MAQTIAVLGLGVMGCATALSLARRGCSVFGFEQFDIGHDRGSSHGDTRVIRRGYFEGLDYDPLLTEAYERWRSLERQASERLLHIVGLLQIGEPNGEIIPRSLAALNKHHLPYSDLDADDVMKRFPAFKVPSNYRATYQPDGGYLLAERAIHAFAKLAQEAGASLRTRRPVRKIERHDNAVAVITDDEVIVADQVVVTAGAWAIQLLKAIGIEPPLGLHATRQVLGWFKPADPSLFDEKRFPVFFIESQFGNHYGFPLRTAGDYRGLVKVAMHATTVQRGVDPDTYDRVVSRADGQAIGAAIDRFIPELGTTPVAAKTCLYTQTNDSDFLIDRLSEWPEVIVASPCSGHGFKFAPVMGERLADFVISGSSPADITQFRIQRSKP